MKKQKIFYVLAALFVCLLFTFVGCSDDTGNRPNDSGEEESIDYTVIFDSCGGSAVPSQKVIKGNPVRSPETPTRENYSFIGWYRSADENAVEWIFATDRVTDNLTLYAKWKPIEEQRATESLTYERNADGYTVTGASGQEERIVIPAEYEGLPVTEIGESAFAYSRHTSGITYVFLPDTITKIGLNAFYNRSELVTVEISGNSRLTSIGRNAFSGNHALTSIYIPQGVTEIGDSAFNNCGSLAGISVDPNNPVYRSEDGHLIERETETLIRGANNGKVPDGVRVIAQAAFRRANGIEELTIPESVVGIGNYFIADSTIAKIKYAGTEAEWEQIEKSSTMWNYGNRDVQVVYAGAPADPAEPEQPDDQKILVVYFSATGTTEKVANSIKEYRNADIFEITPAVPYTSADLNYSDAGSRTSQENRDDAARPEIVGRVENIEQYDVILIGYPIWHGKAPKAVYTFLEQYNFSGKTIIPFCTAASSPIGSSAAYLEELTPGALWKSGTRFTSSATPASIQAWVDEILPNTENEK